MFRGHIQNSQSYDEENMSYFIEQLRLTMPDIVGLQETHASDDPSEKPQTQLIAEALKYQYTKSHTYGPSHIKSGNQLALGTVSRWSISETDMHHTPNPKLVSVMPNGDRWVSFDFGFLISKISFEGRQINFINGHMLPFQYFQRDFMESEFSLIRDNITQFLQSVSGEPTIVCADFNYSDLRQLLPDLFIGGRYKDSFENMETAPGKGQQDHILFSKHFNLDTYFIEKTSSDHYLCIAELSFI